MAAGTGGASPSLAARFSGSTTFYSLGLLPAANRIRVSHLEELPRCADRELLFDTQARALAHLFEQTRIHGYDGVQGFAPAGSGSSPRCAIQMRSGDSANTAPTEPQVQPSCFTPSAPSCSGNGQFCTSS